MPDGSATAHLYRPKLITLLAEGYSFEAFRGDVTGARLWCCSPLSA